MASGSTRWYPYTRNENTRRSWLLDDGTIMEEPALEQSTSRRRVRLAEAHDVNDWMKDLNVFLGRAANEAARLRGRQLWIALGNGPDHNTLDDDRKSNVKTSDLNGQLRPHFLDGESSHRRDRETRAAWRFRHETMPIEAQIEVSVEKHRYGNDGWQVISKLIYPNTWPRQSGAPLYYATGQGNTWEELITGPDDHEELSTRLSTWAQANPIDWSEFNFGVQNFSEERQAINAFAKIVRKVMDLEEIEIPNLLHVTEDVEHVDKQIQMLSLRIYRTNVSQDLLDTLTDYLTGEPVVEQIKEKWLELSSLFRRLGMVIEDPTDTEWWNFVVQGANAAPVKAKLSPVEDDDSPDSTRHSVMINLATGTIVVACSKSSTRDETAIQWETSLIKAEMTGQKDRFLAYADEYVKERQNTRVHEMMDAALKRAKP